MSAFNKISIRTVIMIFFALFLFACSGSNSTSEFETADQESSNPTDLVLASETPEPTSPPTLTPTFTLTQKPSFTPSLTPTPSPRVEPIEIHTDGRIEQLILDLERNTFGVGDTKGIWLYDSQSLINTSW